MRENIAGVRGVGILGGDGGGGREKGREFLLHLLSVRFDSLFPLSHRKALYSG